jgi:hypothetical protein
MFDDPGGILSILKEAGAVGALILFTWAGLTKKIVWGWHYQEKIDEIAYWRNRSERWESYAVRGTNLVEKIADVIPKS